MNARDREIRKELGHEGIGPQLVAVAMTVCFGAAAGLACYELRGAALGILTRLVFSADMESSRYGGAMYIAQLASMFVAAALWVALLFGVSGRIGKRRGCRAKLVYGGAGTAIAAAVWLVAFVAGRFV